MGSIPITRSICLVAAEGKALTLHLTSFPQSACRATNALIAIDVFRAFTTAAFALAGGAAQIVMVGDLGDALALKSAGRVDIAVGERHGLKPEGFDVGNSPTAMGEMALEGKRLALTTTNGTACLAAAPEGVDLYAAALVTARATGKALRGKNDVTVLAAGRNGDTRAPEDELCALYIRSIMLNEPFDTEALRGLLARWFASEGFLEGRAPFGPRTDWLLALELDRFDFAIKVTREEDLLVARAV